MTLPEQRTRLIEDLRLIEDPHERLAAVVDRGRTLPPLAVEERVPANRVSGCVSEMFLVGEFSEGFCRYRIDSGSAMIKGLTGLYCELYDSRSPAEITGDSVDLVSALGLDRMITPNRLAGIRKVSAAMGAFASRHLNPG
jgi:cysteine desulfuration protein SufE